MNAKRKPTPPIPRKGRKLVREPLDSIGGIITEAGKVYRQARAGKLKHDEARSLVWMLAQMRAMVETKALADIEDRLEALAHGGRTYGHEIANRTVARAH